MKKTRRHAAITHQNRCLVGIHGAISGCIYWLTTMAIAISAIGIIITLLLLSYSVAARYFLGRPSLWANDVVTFLLVGIVMFSVASVLREGKHLGVDIITARLRGRALRVAQSWSMVAVILVSAFLVIDGWETAMFSKMLGVTTFGYIQIPLYWLQLLIPLGGFMMILVAMESLFSLALGGKAHAGSHEDEESTL
ncbi:TRAP transporter small permease [Halomonas colorata]|uniref:TRAP transporter small permease n=1 Tax=Halomonas colorata TaxID=2742615 RepID=UPI0018684643|nr:TRAP transporter small permease [Halomonas colorata]